MVFGLSGTGVRLAAEKVFAFSGMRNERPRFRTCGAPGRAGLGGRPPCEFTARLPFFANFHLNRALTPGAGAPPPCKVLDYPCPEPALG